MSATNPNQEIDTLRVTENEDGTFNIEWHPDDPKWNWMNAMSQEQVQIIFEQAMKNFIEETKNESI